jgi:hypothetical protein
LVRRAERPRGSLLQLPAVLRWTSKNLVSDSGWREAPRLRDMSEVKFGTSTCQVEGEIVPVAEITLGSADSIFFEHHVMLWKDEGVRMDVMP